MAIPGQQNINIGQPNQSANSDSLYTAFNTIQNNFTSLFAASSPITALTAGAGINVSNVTTASYQIINTGVTSLVAGNNITITSTSGTPGSNGALIISATGGNGNGGGVTSVGISSNSLTVTNTPIVSVGNINVELSNIVGLVAGNYRNPNVTVDGTGRIINISNGISTGVTSLSVVGGSGISVSGSPVNGSSGGGTGVGSMTVTNTGVTGLVAGTGIVLSAPNGVVTISSTGGGGGGTGTVTSVGISSTTLTVTGSPIVSSGVISVNIPNNLSLNSVGANTGNIIAFDTSNLNIHAQESIPLTATVYSNLVSGLSIQYRRARGNLSVPVAVASGDQIGGFRGVGYTNFNQFQSGSGISMLANGAPANSTAQYPSDVALYSITTSNNIITMRFTNTGNLVVPGSLTTSTAANSAPITTHVVGRARNSTFSPANIVSGDFVYRLLAYGYTGNGLASISGITGYSIAGTIEIISDGVPSSPGGYIPSNAYIRTVSSSNNINSLNFTSTGNLSIPGVYLGNGAGLTNLNGSNVTGTVGNANFASFAGNVTVSSQPNITSLGTLLNLEVSGNANVGGNLSVTGTITGNIQGNISGNITVPGSNTEIIFNDQGNAGASANLTFNGTTLSVTGNVNASNFSGNGSSLSSITGANITGAVAFATTANNVAGANVTGTVSSASTAGTVTTASQPNITSVGTLSSLNVSGTITGNAAGLTYIPAANLNGSVNNNIVVSASANSNNTVGNIVSITINGTTYQLLAK